MTSSLETHVIPAGIPPLLPPFSRLCGACGSFLNPSGVLACADSGAFLTINNTSLFSTGAEDKLVSSATNRPRHKMRCSDGFTPDLVSTSFFKARIFVCVRIAKRVRVKKSISFLRFAREEKKTEKKKSKTPPFVFGGTNLGSGDIMDRSPRAKKEKREGEKLRNDAVKPRLPRGSGSRSQSYTARVFIPVDDEL
jgi:hypothetical protein